MATPGLLRAAGRVVRDAVTSRRRGSTIPTGLPMNRLLEHLHQPAGQGQLLGSNSAVNITGHRSLHHGRPVIVHKRGADLLHDPWVNKHTAFEAPERDRLGLRGLLPPGYQTMEEQITQFMGQYEFLNRRKDTAEDPVALQKWRILNRLHDRNETLYYKILIDNIGEMSKIVYTPTVDIVCQRYASLFRRPRGMYFTAHDAGEMASMVHNWPSDQVDVIVVTDGSRVLGQGDLGIQGIAVPVGKLDMYVSAAGISPNRVLPVMFDVGTNNTELIKNPLYLGLRHPRVDGEDYLELMDEFMEAVFARWPNVIVQFEDFESKWARVLMDRYKTQYRTFNDNIEGTGAMAVAGLLNVLRAQKMPVKALAQTRMVLVGHGSAVQGVATAVRRSMAEQIGDGRHANVAAARNIWIVDTKGLMTAHRGTAPAELREFLRPAAEAQAEDAGLKDGASLLDVVKHVKPHMLMGLSGQANAFTKEVLQALQNDQVTRPAVFACSCPARLSECTAQDAFSALGPNLLFVSGAKFPSVRFADGKIGHSNQANHILMFPGIAAGTHLSGARLISEGMMHSAAHELAHYMSDEQVAKGMIYPQLTNIRKVTAHVAVAVARKAAEEGLAEGISNLHKDQLLALSKEDLLRQVEKRMWVPAYSTLIYGAEQTRFKELARS